MAYMSITLKLMIEAVKKVGIPLSRDFNELEHLQSGVNSGAGFAAHSFEKVAKTLREELNKVKSGYMVVCSEKDIIPASGNYFAVAPIDGFGNFMHANENFAVSVALLENNQIVDAVVYNPLHDELYFTEKGCGAFKEGFRNHERIRIAGNKKADTALMLCDNNEEILQKAFKISSNIRISGCVALDLAHLAAGKADVLISVKNVPYALAAGMLLVKEAGGYIFALGETDVRSEDLAKVLIGGNLIATNEALKQKIANMMA